MSAFLEKIRKVAEDVTAREGCSLWDLEFVGGGASRALRVYIEKPAAEGGVGIDDCANVSRGLNEFLDAQEEEVPGGAYTLEVSSPGLERVLKQKWHFEQVLNKKIYIKTFAPLLELNPEVPELGKAKQLTGELALVNDSGIQMKLEEKLVSVPFDQITKSHTVFEFETAEDKNPKNKKKNKK